MPQYLILLYEDEQSWAEAGDGMAAEMLAGGASGVRRAVPRLASGWLRPAAPATATTIRGWKNTMILDRDRRPFRGDEGSARWLLPRRRRGPGRSVGDRQGGARAVRRGRGSPDPGVRLIGPADPAGAAVAAAVADAHRREWAFVLAATVRVARDLDLAEECVQDAYAQALRTWASRGIPASPGGWLTTVARRRAMDVLRATRRCGEPSRCS